MTQPASSAVIVTPDRISTTRPIAAHQTTSARGERTVIHELADDLGYDGA
jgi:hypothetical protein